MIEVKNISAGYGNGDIIKDVSFTAEKGDYICIVGENGSGKSTLIKALARAINVKNGKIEYSPEARTIGYLPQQTQGNTEFPASVEEVVMSGFCGLIHFKHQKEKAKANMRRLGIENIKNEKFSTLSGGQKQRVLLARALSTSETLLLLDEPVTGLDPIVTEEMYSLISELNKEKQITVIMVSHDVHTAVKYATKVLHLDKTVKFFGSTEEYMNTSLGIHFSGRCCEEHDN